MDNVTKPAAAAASGPSGLGALIGGIGERVIGGGDDVRDRLNRTMLLLASGLMAFAAVLWLVIYGSMGIRHPLWVPVLYLVLSGTSVAVYLWNGKFEAFRFVQVVLTLFVPFVMQWSIGSYVTASGVMLWALLAPIGVMMFQGPRESIPWFVAYVVLTGVSGFFDYFLADGRHRGVPMETIAIFFALNFAAMSTIVYVLFTIFIRQRNALSDDLAEEHRLLVIEQAKSERLLLSVLPRQIADRLKEDSSIIADGHADVTVMFADIINFTRLSEEMPPREMVSLLNDVFSQFDLLAERYGLEKIKTIGDAYMVAGGLTEGLGYTEAIARMALEARRIVEAHPMLSRETLGVHIGISTGPVVAGVIGVRRFIYDLWGNTVNVASRLSSEAARGQIEVDENTYKRLYNRFTFRGPRTISVKGKGPMVVYELGQPLDAPAPQ